MTYKSPGAAELKAIQSEIPPEVFEKSIPDYKEYPRSPDHEIKTYKPLYNVPTTFGASRRFKPKPPVFDSALSAIDYEHLLYKVKTTCFDQQSKRKDNFLSKEQALEIIRLKDEAAMRVQRIQAMKEEQNAENQNKKNPDDDWCPSFNPEDHQRIKSMKPLVRNMVSLIRDQLKSEVLL